MYNSVRNILKITTVAGFDDWLIKNSWLKEINCSKSRGKKETMAGHIRNCIHYKEHGSFTTKNLIKTNKILEELLKKLKR